MTIKSISEDQIGELVASSYHNVPWYHFSVDDVFDSLIDLTINETPLFENSFFALMKEMHDLYDVQVDLELFFEKEIDGTLYTLKDVRDLKKEIETCGTWLRFGPHAQSYQIAPFEQSPEEQKEVYDLIYNEIDRFAGKEYYTEWVRLHFYSESYELSEYFAKYGVTALFTTDRPAGSHRMSLETADNLLKKGFSKFEGANFIRTQFRVEVFTNSRVDERELRAMFKDSLDRFGYIIFYSHEYEFTRSEVRNMLRMTFEVLDKMGVKSIHQYSKI